LDLLPHLHVNIEVIRRNLTAVMPRPSMLLVSSRTGRGINEWVRWLRGFGQRRAAPCASSAGAGVAS